MKRHFIRAGAILGTCALATLAGGPALAATHVSQASAQSLQLSIAGNTAISQEVTATNDGHGEVKNDASTVPTIASVLPGNSLLGVGVAPQDAGATVRSNGDGHSFACAGIAGTGGGIARVGDSSCNINGSPLTINLASLDLGNVLIGSDSALGSALNNIPGLSAALQKIVDTLNNQIVKAVSTGLAGTPLGEIGIGGSLSAIESECTADPGTASGAVHLVDTSGGSAATPISVTLPSVGKVDLVDLPANPPPNTHVLVNLDTVTQSLIDGIKQELNNALNGALKQGGLAGQLAGALQAVQDQLVTVLVQNLQPLLKPLQDNVLDITLNEQPVPQAKGTFEATALDLQVLPAAKQFTGSSLISGQIGHVTCGPNGKVAGPTPTPTPTPTPGPGPHHHNHIPKHVDSGLADYNGSHTNVILAATTALLALAGGAGTLAYRRYWMPRG